MNGEEAVNQLKRALAGGTLPVWDAALRVPSFRCFKCDRHHEGPCATPSAPVTSSTVVHLLGDVRSIALCGRPESGRSEPAHHMTTKRESVTCEKCRAKLAPAEKVFTPPCRFCGIGHTTPFCRLNPALAEKTCPVCRFVFEGASCSRCAPALAKAHDPGFGPSFMETLTSTAPNLLVGVSVDPAVGMDKPLFGVKGGNTLTPTPKESTAGAGECGDFLVTDGFLSVSARRCDRPRGHSDRHADSRHGTSWANTPKLSDLVDPEALRAACEPPKKEEPVKETPKVADECAGLKDAAAKVRALKAVPWPKLPPLSEPVKTPGSQPEPTPPARSHALAGASVGDEDPTDKLLPISRMSPEERAKWDARKAVIQKEWEVALARMKSPAVKTVWRPWVRVAAPLLLASAVAVGSGLAWRAVLRAFYHAIATSDVRGGAR